MAPQSFQNKQFANSVYKVSLAWVPIEISVFFSFFDTCDKSLIVFVEMLSVERRMQTIIFHKKWYKEFSPIS